MFGLAPAQADLQGRDKPAGSYPPGRSQSADGVGCGLKHRNFFMVQSVPLRRRRQSARLLRRDGVGRRPESAVDCETNRHLLACRRLPVAHGGCADRRIHRRMLRKYTKAKAEHCDAGLRPPRRRSDGAGQNAARDSRCCDALPCVRPASAMPKRVHQVQSADRAGQSPDAPPRTRSGHV
jgi:hypothetical protein